MIIAFCIVLHFGAIFTHDHRTDTLFFSTLYFVTLIICIRLLGEMKCEPCNHLLKAAASNRKIQYPVCSHSTITAISTSSLCKLKDLHPVANPNPLASSLCTKRLMVFLLKFPLLLCRMVFRETDTPALNSKSISRMFIQQSVNDPDNEKRWCTVL